MYREIEGKSLLASVTRPDPWFGLRYNLNLYRGCLHGCIYCDSRSECYRIERFDEVLVKVNALDLLRQELPRKREKGTVGTGAMSDPYGPAERHYGLMRGTLELLAAHRFGVHVITKSDLVIRDVELLQEVGRAHHAVVSFSFTTVDDALARKLAPGAPPPSRRLEAIRFLTARGVRAGVLLMPVLPFVTDDDPAIRRLAEAALAHGAQYLLPAFGVTMRDRQREHFLSELERLFPGMRQRYERAFGDRYSCSAPHASQLDRWLRRWCKEHDLPCTVPQAQRGTSKQLRLL